MSEREQELARDLGFLEAFTIGVGTMIGAGIFILPGIAAAEAGPASMVAFAIGGVVSLLAALSLSELATGMPRAGGSYYYVNRAMGSFFGSIVGWGMWAGLMFATAFYMIGFAEYLTFFHPEVPIAIAAILMSTLLILVNYRGVKETGQLQNVIVVALIGVIIAFIAVSVFAVDAETFRPFNPDGWGSVVATAGIVYVAFIGFEVIATSAEEIKNPGRNLPLSMIAAVLVPTILYVAVMGVSTGVLPVPELDGSRIPVADVAEAALASLFGSVAIAGYDLSLGTVGALVMVLGAVLATVSSANASILSAARVNFAMGRDRILSDWLNQIHGTYRTPYRAIIVTGAVILVLIALEVGIETLSEVASFTYLFTYALVHVAVVVMRRSDPEGYDPDFRIPGPLYPTVPIVGFLACIAVITQMSTVVLLIGGVIVLVGIGWYLVYAREHGVRESLVGEAIIHGVETEDDADRPYRVVVPVANPETEERLIRLAAASAHAHENAEIVAVNVLEVPPQTALAQKLDFEEERIERQQALLDSARRSAEELDVGLRTRAIVGRDAGRVILDVIEDEDADEVVLGWSGRKNRREHVFGSTIDPVVTQAPCEVTLVTWRDGRLGDTVTFVGSGPHTPVAVRRSAEFVRTEPDATLTLLTVESPTDAPDEDEPIDDEAVADPETVGRERIDEVAEEAGLTPDDYEAVVVVSDDVEGTLHDRADEYDTVCIGATRASAVEQVLFGSVPESIAESAGGTVAIVRGQDTTPRSVREAIVERLQ